MSHKNPPPASEALDLSEGFLLKRKHCFWLLIVLQAGLLIYLCLQLRDAIALKAFFAKQKSIPVACRPAKVKTETHDFLEDLVRLSKNDAQIQALVQKYNINETNIPVLVPTPPR